MSDESGVITDSYDYEAFGQLLNESGNAENNYRFAGEQLDENLGQYYLRARYYNQRTGRFTQQDTYMGNSQDPVTLHKYLYANADPVNYTDPSGKISLGSLSAGMNIAANLAIRSVGSFRGIVSSLNSRIIVYTQTRIWQNIVSVTTRVKGAGRGISRLKKHFDRWTRSDKFKKASGSGKHNIEISGPSGENKTVKKINGPIRVGKNYSFTFARGGKGGRVLQLKYSIGKHGATKVGGGYYFLFRLDYLDYRVSPPEPFLHYHIKYNGVGLDHVPIL